MKKYLLFLFSIFFLTIVSFAQEGAQKSTKDSTEVHSQKPAAKTAVSSEPQEVSQNTGDINYSDETADEGIQFGMAGMLMLSLENWEKLQTDKSKIGFGISGDFYVGIKVDDMYFGIGPHLGYNFWTYEQTISGYHTSGTWDASDAGLEFLTSWDGFYLTFGMGSSKTSVTATVGSTSNTVEMPDDADYNRVGFGWYEGFLVGLTYTSYKDWATNLSRLEISFGYGF